MCKPQVFRLQADLCRAGIYVLTCHYNVSIYDRQLCFNIGHVMLKYKVYVELLLNICRDRFKYIVYIETYFLIYSNVKVLLEYIHSNNVEM